jgi:hypothetical protein
MCWVEEVHMKFSRKFVHSLKHHCGGKAHTLTWRQIKYGNTVKSSSQLSELHNFWTRSFIWPLCAFTMTATASLEESNWPRRLQFAPDYCKSKATCMNSRHLAATMHIPTQHTSASQAALDISFLDGSRSLWRESAYETESVTDSEIGWLSSHYINTSAIEPGYWMQWQAGSIQTSSATSRRYITMARTLLLLGLQKFAQDTFFLIY